MALLFVIHLQTLLKIVIIFKEYNYHCININLFNVSVNQERFFLLNK